MDNEDKSREVIRTFFIAGVQHHQLYKVIDKIEVGTELKMNPVDDNEYDPNAVELLFEGTMCGFVPMKFSPQITGLLEINDDLKCTVSFLNKEAKPWEQCKVEIWREIK